MQREESAQGVCIKAGGGDEGKEGRVDYKEKKDKDQNCKKG